MVFQLFFQTQTLIFKCILTWKPFASPEVLLRVHWESPEQSFVWLTIDICVLTFTFCICARLNCSLTFVSLSKGIIEPPEGTKICKDSWDFGPYLKILNAAVGDEIFLHSSWIKKYFTWAGFKDYNLVVRIIETDEDFHPFPGGYDYLVDFLDLSFPKERPSREHPYEEIRSRVDVIRHVVKNGLLWDDLYIGFQTRLQRDPDVYHHLFWNHFQIKLPLTPPNWKSFLTHCA